MHPADIHAEIKKRGGSFALLARADGNITAGALANALHRPAGRGERIIAEYLGMSLHKLWPLRYDKAGIRLIRPRGVGNWLHVRNPGRKKLQESSPSKNEAAA